MTAIPFVTLDEPRYGEAVQVAPLVQRVIAHNPSKFTYLGTGTYIVGDPSPGAPIAVIDPGPRLDAHRDALAAAIAGRQVVAVLVTHCHSDHVPLATWLSAETGAPTVGFGPHPRPSADEVARERAEAEQEAAEDEAERIAAGREAPVEEPGEVKVEETTDHDFVPDLAVTDGDVAASGPGWTMRAVHTPGHTSNHLCFTLDEAAALFSGDHVMGWSTSVISPPDGDMAAYLDSLRKVQGRADAVLWPTHGAPVTDPQPYLAAFLAHRLEREANVLAAVTAGRSTIREVVELLYADVRRELHKPARRSVLAHLVKLCADGRVVTTDGQPPRLLSTYAPA